MRADTNPGKPREVRVNYSKVASAIRATEDLNETEFEKFLQWLREEGKI